VVCSRSIVSDGIGPDATSPQNTMRSGCSRSTSRSTAARAGRFPWISASAATRISSALAVLALACFRFGRRLVLERAVEPDTFGVALFVELGADDIPALAEMKDAVVHVGGPALRRDADAIPHPISLSAFFSRRKRSSARGRRRRR